MQSGKHTNNNLGRQAASPNHLVGKVVLLIGHDTAVLKTIATKLAQKGADIALFCRQLSAETSQNIKTQVEAFGRRFLLLSEQELSANNPAENLLKKISNAFGQLDIFIDLSAAKSNVLLAKNEHDEAQTEKPSWQMRQAIFTELAKSS